MGLNYERRGRGEELKVGRDRRLIGYALSDHNINFSKHDFEDAADVVNEGLDRADDTLRDLLRGR